MRLRKHRSQPLRAGCASSRIEDVEPSRLKRYRGGYIDGFNLMAKLCVCNFVIGDGFGTRLV